MIVTAALLGGLGLICMIVRRTLLGVLIGMQLLTLGGTTMLVMSGVAAGVPVEGHLFALFILLGGVGQLVAGYALATRTFLLRRRAAVEELRSLKH
jgi:NADH:ubiquinone oxidoreductase subunit K